MIMAKRGKITPKTTQGIENAKGALPTGIDGSNVPQNFSIPSSGISDVDRAVFNLFEQRLRLEVTVNDKTISVPTIWAGGERVFLVKGNRPPRDKAGAFILPIVSIRRTGIDQSKPGQLNGMGMGQNTGDLVIKKRLSTRDARYQSIVNAHGLQNQDNVAAPTNLSTLNAPQGSNSGTVATRRNRSTNRDHSLRSDIGNNIFEVITMPFPHFYTALYEVTIWTQYVQHMNSIIERFMTSYDAQGNQFRIETDKGYWYVAYVDDSFNSEDNFTDYFEGERFVRYKFNMKVPAYLHGAERYGSGNPLRSYLSSPQIKFEMISGGPPINVDKPRAPVGTGDINRFVLSDIDTLDKRGTAVLDERQTIDYVEDATATDVNKRYLRVLTRNQRKGETVMSKRIFKVFDDIDT